MVEAVFTEISVYPQCRFPGMKAEDAIFRIVRALREVVAHVRCVDSIPEIPGKRLVDDFFQYGVCQGEVFYTECP